MGKIENIIQKLTEAPNLAKAGNYKVGDVTFSKDGGTKYTVLSIDDETGAVEWKTDNLPNSLDFSFAIILSATSFWNINTKFSNQKFLSIFTIHFERISVEIG